MLISFRYVKQVTETKKLDRNFNFVRSTNEKVDVALNRIKSNLQKELTVKSKKKNKKNAGEEQPVQEPEELQVSVRLLFNDGEITEKTFEELLPQFEENTDQFQMLILDDVFKLKFNNPWVNNVTLPNSILANFYVYPSKLQMDFADRHSSEFIWYKGKMPKSNKENEIEWQEIGRGYSMLVKNEDIGYKVKLEVTPRSFDQLKVGPKVEAIGSCEIQPGPGYCPYEMRHLYTTEKLNGNAIRVTSYNILADYYADTDDGRQKLFNYCAQYAIDIDYRKQLLIKEIIGYNSDILCMQEVDFKVFDLDLIPFLNEQNMNGVHDKKGTTPEGLSTFYRTDRFELIENYGMNIGDTVKTHPACQELFSKLQYNEQLVTRFTDLATTLQIVLLKLKEFPNKYIVVANTHLYFHPDADHIRLLQIGFNMILVEDYVKKFKEKYATEDISLLFCGDFNSVPECGIYKLMTEGHVPQDFIDWGSKPEEAVINVELNQPFKIKSACGTPKFTNYTVGFKECLDYIFYQTDKFSVTKVVEMPSEAELSLHNAIPSVVFPSDHIAIVAELEILP
ncbi:2',5'-phosphodiesterase 12 [Chironomus tepperi]|uniref:2',5'-phosphodiesterase 12 n=1 Tax=Chironomus tepperi TaxID=113505 RepID=UPI00391F61DA